MSPEQASKMWPIMRQYCESGKTVQVLMDGRWVDALDPNFGPGFQWRIKPKGDGPNQWWIGLCPNGEKMVFASLSDAESAGASDITHVRELIPGYQHDYDLQLKRLSTIMSIAKGEDVSLLAVNCPETEAVYDLRHKHEELVRKLEWIERLKLRRKQALRRRKLLSISVRKNKHRPKNRSRRKSKPIT